MRKLGRQQQVLLRLIDRHGHLGLRGDGVLSTTGHSAAAQLRMHRVLTV